MNKTLTALLAAASMFAFGAAHATSPTHAADAAKAPAVEAKAPAAAEVKPTAEAKPAKKVMKHKAKKAAENHAAASTPAMPAAK